MFIRVPGTQICNFLACKTKPYLLWISNHNFDRSAFMYLLKFPVLMFTHNRKDNILSVGGNVGE